MNYFSLDTQGQLVYELEDSSFILKTMLKRANFQNLRDHVWIFPSTKDLRKRNKIIHELIEAHEIQNIPLKISENLNELIDSPLQDSFSECFEASKKLKDFCPVCRKTWPEHKNEEKIDCLNQYQPPISDNFKRTLQIHQKLAVGQLLAIQNGGNFSVPGSGKTTISYAVLSKWLADGDINKILVIGPSPSFAAWETEIQFCLKEPLKTKRIQGKQQVLDMPNYNYDLFLMHYSTAGIHHSDIVDFLEDPKHNVALIIDESHNIKAKTQKPWARKILNLASHARKRMILSGTPMPRDAQDLWTQFTFLWPYDNPLGHEIPYRRYAKSHGIGKFQKQIDPLFTRISKSDLGLREPEFHKIDVTLSPVQQEIYRMIAAKTLDEINKAESRNWREESHLQNFRAQKIIRMIQAASNPGLIAEKSNFFDIDLSNAGFPDISESINLNSDELGASIYEKVVNYSKYKEFPTKMQQTVTKTHELLRQNKKVIIWCSFIKNMEIFESQLLKDVNPILIHGKIPKISDPDDPSEQSRDELIQEFKEDSNPRVLIASTAAMSESVSLHVNTKLVNGREVRTPICQDAIYLDRNFNAAQYMQSLDRIHRLGMDKDTLVHYYCMISKNTIDQQIDEKLTERYENMLEALKDPWLQGLDLTGTSIEISKEQSAQDFDSLKRHLRDVVNDNSST